MLWRLARYAAKATMPARCLPARSEEVAVGPERHYNQNRKEPAGFACGGKPQGKTYSGGKAGGGKQGQGQGQEGPGPQASTCRCSAQSKGLTATTQAGANVAAASVVGATPRCELRGAVAPQGAAEQDHIYA